MVMGLNNNCAPNNLHPFFIERKKLGLNVKEIFFPDTTIDLEFGKSDIIKVLQGKNPDIESSIFYTSVIDLIPNIADIEAKISKGFRYEIKRSQSDNIKFEILTSPSICDVNIFIGFYDKIAIQKQIPKANLDKLLKIQEKGGLSIAWMRKKENSSPLAAHVYIVCGQRARLYYSASATFGDQESCQRQLVGRSNKSLHWNCIKHFKENHLKNYDFGGISKTDELKSIDQFKEQFGGELVKEYNTVYYNSTFAKSLKFVHNQFLRIQAKVKQR